VGEKVRLGETPRPALETSALPGVYRRAFAACHLFTPDGYVTRDSNLRPQMSRTPRAVRHPFNTMLSTPQILQSTAQPIASIHLVVPRAEIRNVMGPGLEELMGTLAAQRITPVGPWFTYHRRMDPDVFDFEIGIPVSSAVTPAGRVQPGELRSRKIARTIYTGPYEGLGEAWGEFTDWIEANGHQPAPDLWECYVHGSEATTDSATFRTELNRPLLE
jgi:effector-binding domain-containing protein